MSIYYLIFVLLTSIILAFCGLALAFLPTTTLSHRLHNWYKHAFHNKPPQKKRIEPNLENTGIKKLKTTNENNHSLLFENTNQDHKNFFILYLMAPSNQEYAGYLLWQALMSQKLRYGPMRIFHAYEDDNPNSKMIFSVANALEPGYFEADHIDKIKTPGLCFFMQNHGLSTPLKSFENMVKVAKRLEHLLGGILCNHQRQSLSEAMLQSYYTKLSVLTHQKDSHG